MRAARRSGEEYLLERGLFRRKSTGEVVEPAYLEFAFPYYWHYDVLRALDYFRRVRRRPGSPDGGGGRGRAVEAAARRPVAARPHPSRVASTSTSRAASGTPSRWNTLRALRVLDWWDGS